MTREEIIEYFMHKENRKAYSETLEQVPNAAVKKNVSVLLEKPENVEHQISVQIGQRVVTEDEIAQYVESDSSKRSVFFVGKDGSIRPLQESDPQEIKKEFARRMKAGDLCVLRDSNEITRLFKNETYKFGMSFFGGKELEIEAEEAYHRIAAKNQEEYLQQYGFTKKAAQKLLSAKSAEWMDPMFVRTANLEIPQGSVADWKNKMDALWDTVHGASLWWKNSGSYTDMHNKIREINEHLNEMPDTASVADDAEMKQMLVDLKIYTDNYLTSKKDVKSFSENGQKRLDAAKAVSAALTGFGRQNSRSAEAEEPQVEEPQEAQAEEPQKPEVEEPQEAQIEEPEEPQVEEAKSFSVQELLDHLKENDMVEESLTVEQFALAVINSAPVSVFDKERYTEEDIFRNPDNDLERGALLRREYGEFLRNLRNGAEISDEYKDILSRNIFKAVQNPTYDIGKLKDFNESLISCREDTDWKFGEEILDVFGDNGLKKFTSENMKSQEQKKVYAQSTCLLEERRLINYANNITLDKTTRGVKLVRPEDVPEYLAAEIMETCAQKNLVSPNTLYYLKVQGFEKFSGDVCKAMKGLLTLPRTELQNYVKVEDIQNRVSANSDAIVDRLNEYCNMKVEELREKQQEKQKAAAKKEAPKKEDKKKVVTGRSL